MAEQKSNYYGLKIGDRVVYFDSFTKEGSEAVIVEMTDSLAKVKTGFLSYFWKRMSDLEKIPTTK